MQTTIESPFKGPKAYYLYLIKDINEYIPHKLKEKDQELFNILIYYLLWSVEQGNLCIDLNDSSNFEIFKKNFLNNDSIEIDSLKKILKKVYKSPQFDKIFEIYQDQFFFFRKHYEAQILIKQKIEALRTQNLITFKQDNLKKIQSYFQNIKTKLNIKQKLGVLLSLLQRFLIISGGPGTGKTTVASHIIGLHLSLGVSPYRIAISAPTGRAASRLHESLKSQLSTEDIGLIEPKTLHRLLYFRPYKNEFYYGENNHLPFDIILVDEASMIDIFLLKQLFSAINFDTTKLILLGDHNQLPSVQEGNTLSDLIPPSNFKPKKEIKQFLSNFFDKDQFKLSEINPYFVELEESYRNKKYIKFLADAIIKEQDYKVYLNKDEVEWIEKENLKEIKKIILKFIEENIIKNIQKDLETIKELPKEEWKQDFSETNPIHRIYETITNYKILTPYNTGSLGVQSINETILNEFFSGKKNGVPIIITENDYYNNLYNGDIGIFLQDKKGSLYACFKSSNKYIFYYELSLSHYDYSFAITIHKSQGSEYKKVLLILPDAEEESLISLIHRQILYTGITRAKEKLILVSNKETLEKAVQNKIVRISGIKIWE